jgi:hypothetical protein
VDIICDLSARLSTPGTRLLSTEELANMSAAELAADVREPTAGRQALELARSLNTALERLDRFLSLQGVQRVGRIGESVSGLALRVVDRVERPDFRDGAIVSVIRCGFVRGAEVLREGDVVVNRLPAARGAFAEPSAAVDLGAEIAQGEADDCVGH